ncbi:MAG TPA: ATP-binding cassette domain-containing protein, partial [Pseudobdellovibrionaceae bacterium]|nr:ATP-binding cassette domain-containing protein [Pseudobdellovibrionaceae bacterium]
MSNQELHVSCKKLSKIYNNKTAVHPLDLEIYKGECFGLLGANGAGKSTLLKMFYAHTEPSQGDLFILGLNIKKNASEVKSRIGIIPQENQLDIDFNVYDNLLLFSQYHNIP